MKKVKDKSLMFIQGNYLRELRRCHTDYTQAQVAECVGKSKQWVSDVENGKNDIFYTDLVKLITCYGVDLNTAMKELNHRMFENK